MTAYILAGHGRITKERKDIGFGQQAAESFQNFFAAAPIEQPVMDERRAHVVYQLTADGAIEYPRSHRFFTTVTRNRVISNECEFPAGC